MTDQPRNSDPFDIHNHMPAGAKLDDPYTGPSGYAGGTTSTLTVKRTPWWKRPATAVAAGVGVLALLSGAAIGVALPHSSPKECAVALDYAEQAIGHSADGMGAIADGAGGSYYAQSKAIDKLDQVTKDLKRITPLYQDAKAVCLK